MMVSWAFPIAQAQLRNTNLFMVCLYARDEYLMMKTTPAPDAVDDDDEYYAAPLQIPPPWTRQ